jgi:hypothetical protein
LNRAWTWLIGGLFVAVLVVAVVQYRTPKPIGERIDQQTDERPTSRPDTSVEKSTEDARPDNASKAARLDIPSEDTQVRETTGVAQPPPPGLTSEQRDKIRGLVAGPRESRVDTSEFTPTVGTTVPAHVLLHHLPPELADIMGGYHGSDYLIVLDKLVIVDPNVRRIVAVVPGV